MEYALCTSSTVAAFAAVIAMAVMTAQMIVLIQISPGVGAATPAAVGSFSAMGGAQDGAGAPPACQKVLI
jgi:hypothetical protein